MTLATFFFHQGMVITGVPYSSAELLTLDEMSGGTPYGASHVAGMNAERPLARAELTLCFALGTRLADVALAWNILQHFYPYFDVVQTDWPQALRSALTSAANATERQLARLAEGAALEQIYAEQVRPKERVGG